MRGLTGLTLGWGGAGLGGTTAERNLGSRFLAPEEAALRNLCALLWMPGEASPETAGLVADRGVPDWVAGAEGAGRVDWWREAGTTRSDALE